jgi:tRNA-specific 2-thiouridylase
MAIVAVGMSGGVDSAVAGLLLKERGYEVFGLFMHNWEETDADGNCAAEADFTDVKAVCDKLDIPYYSVNLSGQYRARVFERFLSEYAAGRTPNPDVLCNREIKFDPFIKYARSLGADFAATGHYCGVRRGDGYGYLLKAADTNKDQTYFLNQVSGAALCNVLFPLADLRKAEVRALARKNALPVAEKKDSTGICFIGERKFRQFLSGYLPARPGEIRDADGRTVGRHEGLAYYTQGQRRGLNIGGVRGGEGRWFVTGKDLKENVLYVSRGDESPLMSRSAVCGEVNWIPFREEAARIAGAADGGRGAFRCTAKFRHRQPEQGVTVTPLPNGSLRIEFDTPQRAITPGQYAVFYSGEYCIGGGVIFSDQT